MLRSKILLSVLGLSAFYGNPKRSLVRAEIMGVLVNETLCDIWIDEASAFDTDGEEGLSEPEYLNMLNGFLDDYFTGCCTTYRDLPLIFKSVHKFLSCSCVNLGGDSGCCEGDNAVVPLDGFALADSERTEVQKQYREDFCLQLTHAIQTGTTMRPTTSPTITPTGSPLAAPTSTPPTVEPTGSPENPTTTPPTASPETEPTTASPTFLPTKTPTAEPTVSPTSEPTASPTSEPTATPTVEPTASPTSEPTASPTASPTSEPTNSPTMSPIAPITVGISFIGSVGMKFSSIGSEQEATVQRDLTQGAKSLVMEIIDSVGISSVRMKFASIGSEQGATVQRKLMQGAKSLVMEIIIAAQVRHTRKLQKLSPEFDLKGFSDIECPEGLVYARKGDPCVEFNADVVFPPNFVLRLGAQDFRSKLEGKIDKDGALYNAVVKANANTAINGLGKPGAGKPPNLPNSGKKTIPNNVPDPGGLGIGAIIGIIIGVLLIVVLVLALMAISKRKRDEIEVVREFAGEAALDEEAPAPVKTTKDMPVKEEVADDERSEEQEAPLPVTDNDDDNSVSSGSFGWSDANDSHTTTSDIVDENDPEKTSVASTLAAMGVASTATSQLVSTPYEDEAETNNALYNSGVAAGTPQIDRDLDDIRSEVESLAKHVMPNRSTDSLMNEYIGLENKLIEVLRGMSDQN